MAAFPIVIDGWCLDRTLGAGGFGIVQLLVHKQTGAKFAIKKCKWDSKQLTETQIKRWANEVQIMKRLKHPNIVRSIDLPFLIPDSDMDMPILCMEYCTKGDLRRVLNETENCCGISEKDAINVMKDISSAMEYLHSNNITHRDLKPENIVLQDECNKVSYKLIDLGYAKELGEASTSASIVGTLNYVAPELLWKEKYSCSVDYWSLGILFYELVTGTRPFLPRMQHTMTWMGHIRNKEYDDICAYECDDKIVFEKDIVDPTHISRCLREKLVEWFRVVLQWDPKQRGKRNDEKGTPQLVVFKLLHSILCQKIVHVFSISSYKLEPYNVHDSTSIEDLQRFIEKHNNIPLNQQVLTDYFGNVLVEHGISLQQIENPVLFVFENGSALTENVPDINIPKVVQKMIEQPKSQLDFETLKDYYRVTIFFMKQEVYLFQLYIFALSIEVDLILARLNKFNENITSTLESTNTLLGELRMIRTKWEKEIIREQRKKDLENNFEKVMKLASATDRIKEKFHPLVEDSNELKDAASCINCIALSELYNQAVTIYETHKNDHRRRRAKPTEMVKVVFEFLRIREAEFQNENILGITSQISRLKVELMMLERIFDSVLAMKTVYQEELQNITQCDQQNAHKDLTIAHNSTQCAKAHNKTDQILSNEADNVIYDNLVIRYTLDNLLAEIHKKYVDMVRLEP